MLKKKYKPYTQDNILVTKQLARTSLLQKDIVKSSQNQGQKIKRFSKENSLQFSTIRSTKQNKKDTQKNQMQIKKSLKIKKSGANLLYQTDKLCFFKLISIIKNYLLQKKLKWDFQRLSYNQFIIILYVLGYISQNKEDLFMKNTAYQQELQNIFEVWIKFSFESFISLNKCLQIIANIQRLTIKKETIQAQCQIIKTELQQFQIVSMIETPKFVFYINKLALNQKEINNKLQSFKLHQMNLKKQSKLIFNFEQTFFPKISQNSKIIMKVQRQNNKKQKNKQLLLQKMTTIQDVQTVQTFSQQNNIIQDNKKNDVLKNKKAVEDIVQKLFKPKKKDCHMNDISFITNKEQNYSFRPQIHQYIKNQKPISFQQQKNIARIYFAREMKNEIIKSKQRGWTRSHSVCDLKNYGIKIIEQEQQKTQRQQQLIKLQKLKQDFINQKKKQTNQSVTRKKNTLKIYQTPIIQIIITFQTGQKQTLFVCRGDTAKELAFEFGRKHCKFYLKQS